jgi:hypothetical protein
MVRIEPLETRRLLATWYVAPNGSDALAGTSTATPFATVNRAIQAASPGDTILLRGGTYRQSILLDAHKSGSASQLTTIAAFPGERPVIKGSDLLTKWSRVRGGIWRANTFPGTTEQVFVNFDATGSRPLEQIGSAGNAHDRHRRVRPGSWTDLTPGTFLCDTGTRTLYVYLPDGSSPRNHVMEVSTRPSLVELQYRGYRPPEYFRISGLTFRHNASSRTAEQGAMVHSPFRSLIDSCDIQWADFAGVTLNTGTTLRDTAVRYCGAVGVQGAHAGNVRVSKCLIERNNYRGFDSAWHAGGIKLVPGSWGTVDGSRIRNNAGSGVWFDYCETGNPITVRNNRITGNGARYYDDAGVKIEVTDRALVTNNIIDDNFGSGVLVLASDHSRILANTVTRTRGWGAINLGGVPRDGKTLHHNRISNNIVSENRTRADLIFPTRSRDVVAGNRSDHNLLFRRSGPIILETDPPADGLPVRVFHSLAQWNQALGLDEGSIHADPLLDSSLRPAPQSPARGAGTWHPEIHPPSAGPGSGQLWDIGAGGSIIP